MDINQQHGDESQAAHEAVKNGWLGVVAIVVAAIALVAVLASTAVGPGLGPGRVNSSPTPVESVAQPKTGLPPVNLPGVTPPSSPQSAAAGAGPDRSASP
jgi:hypothetical protein